MKSKISYILIYICVVFAIFALLIVIFREDVFKDYKTPSSSASTGQSMIIDNTLVNGKKEFLDVIGLNIYIKHEGELTITVDEKYKNEYIEKGFESSHIMSDKGYVLSIGEKIKEIKPHFNGSDISPQALLVLSVDGALYNIKLEDIKNNNLEYQKYISDKKIISITTGKLDYVDSTKRSLAKVNENTNCLIGKTEILEDISKYQLGKKTEVIKDTTKYVVIEEDSSSRIRRFYYR